MTLLQPRDAKQAAEMIGWAASEDCSVEIVAGASKRALGRPPRADHRLDVSKLAGVVDYDPAELLLAARPATPLAEIEKLLAQKGQMLAFEPPDWRGLLGGSGEPSIGGVLACNMAGPRRLRAGAARDFLLGFAAINGMGEAWKAGGKVVKNVTGYDLCKLQAGAFGTLSLLTEIALKVMPRPETACTIVVQGLADEKALPVMAQALNTPHEVSAAAHLPAATAKRSNVLASQGAATLLRLEGPAPSVAYRAKAIIALLGGGECLAVDDSAKLWSEIGAVRPLLPREPRIVWRLCTTPSLAAAVARAVRVRLASAEAFYDWGGGLVWLSLDAEEAGADAGAAAVRASMHCGGGHATLFVAPDALREKVAVFEPSPRALCELQTRVKRSFDPRYVLNPGRMREE